MQYKDYYRILGVPAKASEEEIRKAYKKLAMQYHPDRNPDNPAAEDKFKEINEAKEILLNADYRARYDALRSNWRRSGAAAGAAGGYAGSRPAPPTDVNSLFTRFMKEVLARRKNKKKVKGNLKISLKEAYKGIHTTLKLDDKRVKVKIPPGVSDDQTLRLNLKAKGEEDLYIRIKVQPDIKFERKKRDLFTETSISVYDAVLGQKVQIDTLKGPMKVSIPAGTQHGEKLKLRGLGMPDFDHPTIFGNLYLKVNVKIPKKLSAQEKQLFEQLAALQK